MPEKFKDIFTCLTCLLGTFSENPKFLPCHVSNVSAFPPSDLFVKVECVRVYRIVLGALVTTPGPFLEKSLVKIEFFRKKISKKFEFFEKLPRKNLIFTRLFS